MRHAGIYSKARIQEAAQNQLLAVSQAVSGGGNRTFIYKRAGDVLSYLGEPQPAITYDINAPMAFSPDGNHLALTTNEGLAIYKRSGDTFTKTSQNLNDYAGWDWIAYSPDGQHLVLSSYDTGVQHDLLCVLKRSGDTYTKIFSTAMLVGADAAACAVYSSDGSRLIVSVSYVDTKGVLLTALQVYNRSGDSYALASTLPIGQDLVGSGWITLSPDGVYIAGSTGFGSVKIYKLSGTTITKLTTLTLTGADIGGVAFSPDGMHLCVTKYLSPGFVIYKRSGDTFTPLSAPAFALEVCGVPAYSQDGQYLNLWDGNLPWIHTYKRSGDTYTHLASPAAPPSTESYSMGFLSTWPLSFFG